MGREPRRRRGCRSGGLCPLLAVAGTGEGPCRVPVRLRPQLRSRPAARRSAASEARVGSRDARGRAGLRRAAGTSRARRRRRGGAEQLARGAARGAGDEDLARSDRRPNRRGPGGRLEYRRLALPLRHRAAAEGTRGGGNAMNDNFDPLEEELAGLKPRQPSPELSRRVDERLGWRRWENAISAFLAGVLAIALVLAVLVRLQL